MFFFVGIHKKHKVTTPNTAKALSQMAEKVTGETTADRQKTTKRVVTKENVTLWDIFLRIDALYRQEKKKELSCNCKANCNKPSSKSIGINLPIKTASDVQLLETYLSNKDNYQELVSIYHQAIWISYNLAFLF